jgi:uncharacterized membrane protein YjgN (DUF898 family)
MSGIPVAALTSPRPSSLPAGGAASYSVDTGRVATSGSDLGRIVWRGQALTIVTLGIYRFWYRTNLRRWYWRNTIVGGDGFEYRGTPRELFIGFLVAVAITLPLYFAGALAALFFASEAAGNIATVVGVGLLGVLAQYGAYRSRRFRLTRTVWRGLRFDQTGSPWRYAFVSLGWVLAIVLTLGLLLPLARRAFEAIKVRNTVFGTATGSFRATAGGLMLRWLPLWFALIALMLAMFYFIGVSGLADGDDAELTLEAALAPLSLIGMIVVFCLGWPIYRAAEFRTFAGGSTIGPVAFRSDLGALALYGMYVRFGLLVIALGLAGLILASVLFAALFTSLRSGGPSAAIGAPAIGAGALFYLGGAYLFMSLKELVLNQAFWRRAAESITVTGLNAIAGITARPGDDEMATGEGLADALDFGGV